MKPLNSYEMLTRSLIGDYVYLFDKLPVLTEAVERLQKVEFKVVEIDWRETPSFREFWRATLFALGIIRPDEFSKGVGPNLFGDMLFELKIPEEHGLILVIKNYGDAFREDAEVAQFTLGYVARSSRYFLQLGLRFVTLMHVDDRGIEIEPLWTQKAHWNRETSFAEDTERRRDRVQAASRALSKVFLALERDKEKYSQFQEAFYAANGVADFSEFTKLDLSSAEVEKMIETFRPEG